MALGDWCDGGEKFICEWARDWDYRDQSSIVVSQKLKLKFLWVQSVDFWGSFEGILVWPLTVLFFHFSTHVLWEYYNFQHRRSRKYVRLYSKLGCQITWIKQVFLFLLHLQTSGGMPLCRFLARVNPVLEKPLITGVQRLFLKGCWWWCTSRVSAVFPFPQWSTPPV